VNRTCARIGESLNFHCAIPERRHIKRGRRSDREDGLFDLAFFVLRQLISAELQLICIFFRRGICPERSRCSRKPEEYRDYGMDALTAFFKADEHRIGFAHRL
jgi:hypothetical protein